MQQHSFLIRPCTRNTSGVNGISETYTITNGKKYFYFKVFFYNEQDQFRNKKFYFTKKTRDEAFKKAVDFRKKYESKLMYGNIEKLLKDMEKWRAENKKCNKCNEKGVLLYGKGRK